ncbi:MAG: type II toxin-antitoxin system VapC family toxin [Gemmatimonadota bacterium]
MIRPSARTIHLDTSFLIRALDPTFAEWAKLRGWLRARRTVGMCALAWGEFLCGPLGEADKTVARRVTQRHMPVTTAEATEAARLFNHAGRRRNSFPDCIIAATAILAGAELATSNPADFERFLDAGLELAE